MSLVKFHARNHRQQVGKRGADPAVDDRATAPETFAPLNERFAFTLDVAAAAHNPPYSKIGPWVEKAWAEHERAEVIVLLLPANRTEQTWWQEMVEPYRDRPGSPLRVEFLRGRLRFIARGRTEVGPNERPPFGCCLLIWNIAAREAA